MQNLNQIRARHVLEFAQFFQNKGKNDGEVVKKIPPVIMNNGLLAALAYSMDGRNEAWCQVFNGIASHLASPEIGMIPQGSNNAEALLEYLVSEETSSQLLREVTDEAARWLEFARRLVK